MSNIKLSPSQASKLFAISQRSIRRAIKNKEIPVTIHNFRYEIDFRDMFIWSQKLPNRQNKRDEFGIGRYVEKWNI